LAEELYYIRIRGRVLGPFTLERLKSLRTRGQFSRVNEVSTDRQHWQPASTIDNLIAPPREDASSAESEKAHPQVSGADQHAPVRGASWYYNIASEQHGPVSIIELRSMLNAGTLHPNDHVWKEGMSDWLPVSHIAELQASPLWLSSTNRGSLADGFQRPGTIAIAAHRGGTIVTFGILGLVICLPFGIAAWVMGNHDLQEMAAGRMDRTGEGLTKSGKIMGIIACCFAVAVFALNMLLISIGRL